VFGGLYLNYLRHAIYEHLIRAEVDIDQYTHSRNDFCEIIITDFDKDGNDELIISNSLLNLYLAPAYGGSIFEIDYKPKFFNLINTLARREEVYHDKIKRAKQVSAAEAGVASIHEIVKVKEKGLENALVYDWHRRLCLLDHFLAEDTDLIKFSEAKYQELGDFTIEPFEFIPQRRGNEVSITLRRFGKVAGNPVKLEKVILLYPRQSIINISYEITNLGEKTLDLWFGSEFNLSLLAGRSEDRYYEIEGFDLEDRYLESSGELNGVRAVKLVDEWKKFRVLLEWDKFALFWRFPIKTVSQSESGFERTYQGSVLFPSWKFSLGPAEKWGNKIVLRIEE
ncbi:MAG: alpha-amylase/4-alpha-glucanotransferase domain-containing protein, partial [Candidatus Margulisiibacteriota bacterium]